LCCRQKWGEQGPCCVAHVRGILIFWHSSVLRKPH
jgi:hypothetical protein